MAYIIGPVLGVLICGFARAVGFDRDRAFYPTVLIVIALYYVLFAVMAGATQALLLELVQVAAFTAVAVVGFKRGLGIVAAGLVGHGVFDLMHAHLVTNQGVPEWWPAFCSSIDVAMGLVLAVSRNR